MWHIVITTVYRKPGYEYHMEETMLALASLFTAPGSSLSSASRETRLFVVGVKQVVETLSLESIDVMKVLMKAKKYIGAQVYALSELFYT